MKIDNFRLRRNIKSSSISFLINLALVFLSYRLIIGLGGIELLGLWSAIYACVSLVKIGDVGMASANLRFVSLLDLKKDRDMVRSVIATGICTNFFIFSVVTIIGYFVITLFISAILDSQYIDLALDILPVMFFSFFLFNFYTVLVASLQGMHYGYITANLNVIGSLIQLVFVYLLIPKLGLLGMALAQVIQYCAVIIFASVAIYLKSGVVSTFPHQFNFVTFKDMMGFSVKSQISNVANGLFEPISKIVIGYYGGLAAQGVYEIAHKSLWIPRNAVITGVTATIPAVTKLLLYDKLSAKVIYNKSKNLSIKIVSVISVLVIIVSPMISQIWLGAIDWKYSLYVLILSVGVITNAYGASAYNLAICTGIVRNNIFVNISSILLLLVVTVALTEAVNEYFLVAVVSLLLSVSGLCILKLNEKLIN